jgi:DegV family protein with EDD domain
MGIVSVPLTMTLGVKEFRDDELLDMDGFMDEMKNYNGKAGSASPPPFLYQEAIEASDDAFIVTLSGKLSGSYNNAIIGNNMANEDGTGAAYIFDSKSASAGETLVAIKIHELIDAGATRAEIIKTVNQFIDGMKTYFVLENHDNLQKNGRLSRITGSFIRMLNIKLIMGADGNGEIALYEKCRGVEQMIQKLLSFIQSSGREIQSENLVISHCNNRSLAERLQTLIKERFSFKKVFVVPTGGLSSLYTDNKGIVLAF